MTIPACCGEGGGKTLNQNKKLMLCRPFGVLPSSVAVGGAWVLWSIDVCRSAKGTYEIFAQDFAEFSFHLKVT
jgi:hypothetical protein